MKSKIFVTILAAALAVVLMPVWMSPEAALAQAEGRPESLETAIAAGHFSSFAIRRDGSLWGWGLNVHGVIGDGTFIQPALEPMPYVEVCLSPLHYPIEGESFFARSPLAWWIEDTFLWIADEFFWMLLSLRWWIEDELFWILHQVPYPVLRIAGFMIVLSITGTAIALPVVGCLLLVKSRRNAVMTSNEAKAKEPPGMGETGGYPKNQHMALLNGIRASTGLVSDVEIIDKIVHIEKTVSNIFCHVEEYPNKMPQIRRLVDHYLPALLKMIRSYSAMEKQGVKGDNIIAARNTITRTLDALANGFDQLLDQLFSTDVIDMCTDMDVIENMLRQDNLAGIAPFKKIVTDDN